MFIPITRTNMKSHCSVQFTYFIIPPCSESRGNRVKNNTLSSLRELLRAPPVTNPADVLQILTMARNVTEVGWKPVQKWDTTEETTFLLRQ